MGIPAEIRGPLGYWMQHNENLVAAMVNCPAIAKAAAKMAEAFLLYAETRGMAMEDVDVGGRLVGDGYLVLKLIRREDPDEI